MSNTSVIKRIIIIVIVLAVLVGGTIGGIALYRQQEIANAQAEVVPVDYIRTSYWQDNTSGYGQIEQDYIQQIFYDPSQNISEIYVQLGDEVKIGDKLLEYDKEKLEIEEQSAALDVSRVELTISDTKDELNKLYNTKPFVPTPEPTLAPTPTPKPSYAVLYEKITLQSNPYMGDGTLENPYVFLCTEEVRIDSEFLLRMLGVKRPITPTSGTTFTLNNSDTELDPNAPDPIVIPNDDKPFVAIFEVRIGGTEHGTLIKSWMMDGNNLDAGFFVPLPDIPDEDNEDDINPDDVAPPEIFEPQYTREELDIMIRQKQQELADAELQKKQADINYNLAKLKLDSTTVLSNLDGTVISLTDLETASLSGEPFLTVAGGTGVYIKSSINESQLSTISVGNKITVYSWNTGQNLEGEILDISFYPIEGNDNYGYGGGNPNNSSYEILAYVEDGGALANSYGVEIQFSEPTDQIDETLYLDAAYVRDDEQGYYVLKAGEDEKIVKQYVGIGKYIYDKRYVEITFGIELTDRLTFPYGKNAVEGAQVIESENGGGMYGW